MSRRVFQAVLSADSPDVDVSSIAYDIRRLMKQEVVGLSHESLCEFLLSHNSSEMIDLLRQNKVFKIKSEHLKINSPLNVASERQLLFLLTNSSRFDLRHLNLSILCDYLISLNKAKISKHVLEDFIKYSMRKVSKE